jgi:hypothetical protein
LIGYAESNFVLEIALGQEAAADARELLAAAQDGQIELAVPIFALCEPYGTVTNNAYLRRRTTEELDARLRRAERNEENRELAAAAREGWATAAFTLDKQETDALEAVIAELLEIATVLPLTPAIHTASIAYQTEHDLPPADAIVYATVVDDLGRRGLGEPKFFANRDAHDFGTPGIRDQLREFNCEFFFTFGAARGFLRR